MDDRPTSPEEPRESTEIGRSVELRPGGRLSRSAGPEPPVAADFPAFRRLTLFSVLGGLCPLLPSAVAEDPAFTAVCTRMVTELGESRDLALTPEEVGALACPAASAGSLSARAQVWLRHLLRRPFPGLALGRAVGRTVETFGRGYLLLHSAGLEMAEVHPPDRTAASLQQVRAAIAATLAAADQQPLEQAIAPAYGRSVSLLLRAADLLAGLLGRTPEKGAGALAAGSGILAAEDELLRPLVDEIAARLWSDREGLAGLAKAFESRLAGRRGPSL